MASPRFLSHPLFLILTGAALLMVPPLLNGFPFIFPDSTDYLTLAPQIFRLPFYGLFITFFHWNHFIWGPVIGQCLIASHLLWLMVSLTSGKPAARHFLPFMLVMTLFSTLPLFTGFIMADIFTPILFLTFYILCFYHRRLSGLLRCYLFLLACIAIVTQIANLSLALGLFILLMVLLTVSHAPRRVRLKSVALTAIPILLSITAVLLFNGLLFGFVSLAPAGQSFFMANMIEYGPARHYLETSCPTKHYRLCAYRPLPKKANDLMWADGSVFWRLGGFVGMRQEAAEIVKGTLETYPNEVRAMIVDNFFAGLKTHQPGAEFLPQFAIPALRTLVRDKFSMGDLDALLNSAEIEDRIPHDALIAIDNVTTPTCFVLLVLIALATIRSRPPAFTMATATILFILGNVLLCTALSGVYDRYQTRVTWLMPMVLGLLLIAHLKKNRAREID